MRAAVTFTFAQHDGDCTDLESGRAVAPLRVGPRRVTSGVIVPHVTAGRYILASSFCSGWPNGVFWPALSKLESCKQQCKAVAVRCAFTHDKWPVEFIECCWLEDGRLVASAGHIECYSRFDMKSFVFASTEESESFPSEVVEYQEGVQLIPCPGCSMQGYRVCVCFEKKASEFQRAQRFFVGWNDWTKFFRASQSGTSIYQQEVYGLAANTRRSVSLVWSHGCEADACPNVIKTQYLQYNALDRPRVRELSISGAGVPQQSYDSGGFTRLTGRPDVQVSADSMGMRTVLHEQSDDCDSVFSKHARKKCWNYKAKRLQALLPMSANHDEYSADAVGTISMYMAMQRTAAKLHSNIARLQLCERDTSVSMRTLDSGGLSLPNQLQAHYKQGHHKRVHDESVLHLSMQDSTQLESSVAEQHSLDESTPNMKRVKIDKLLCMRRSDEHLCARPALSRGGAHNADSQRQALGEANVDCSLRESIRDGCVSHPTEDPSNYNGERRESAFVGRVAAAKKQLSCAQCGNVFSTRSNLARHMRSAHEDQSVAYPCEECERTFTSRSNLQRHVTDVHLKIRMFRCSHCNVRFRRKFDAQRHEAAIHGVQRDNDCAVNSESS
uniref:C2H2-type domain-containing protein n=1 Tax=Erythrolobus australicus TaxID=1077150 RepID=A0A7S1XIB8_9RHOD